MRPRPAFNWEMRIYTARWDQLAADVLTFERKWLDTAIALGWTERGLFAVHPTRPEVRCDRVGLLWLLNGVEITALDSECAVIHTKRGNIRWHDF